MDYLRLELRRTINGDPVPIAFHRHAQGFGHCVTSGSFGNLQLVAIVTDGTVGRAKNDGAFFGDIVRNRGMSRLRTTFPLDGVALESFGLFSRPQRLQRLLVAVERLLFQPIRPSSPLVLFVQLLTLSLVLLVDRLNFIFQRLMGLRVQ